jgi:sugar O-acyltransferase (sialic acid O-acetyltransferase NeuD family)
MQSLYIVGAGGFGREVYCWLQDMGGSPRPWDFCGFLDDDADALRGMNYEKGVVGSIADFVPKVSDLLVCGLGSVAVKKKLCEPLIARGAEFLTVIHPTAVIGANVQLGRGVILSPGVVLTCDINIGDMVMVNCCSSAGHDVSVGDWSTISAHCDLTGYTTLGQGVFLGSGARIIPGKSVGDFASVGAGSVVIRSVAAGQKVFGNPARVFA